MDAHCNFFSYVSMLINLWFKVHHTIDDQGDSFRNQLKIASDAMSIQATVAPTTESTIKQDNENNSCRRVRIPIYAVSEIYNSAI